MSEHKVFSGTLDEINEQLRADGFSPNDEPVEPTTPPETPPAPPADPPPAADPAPAFDRLKFLSEELGQPFNSDDELSQWKSTITDQRTLFEQLNQQYEQAQQELKNYDIRKHFATDEDFILNQLKIKYPDLNPKVLSGVLTTDITTSDPIATIAYSYMLNDKGGKVFHNEQQAYNYVCKQLGVDKDLPMDEQEEDVQVSVRLEAAKAAEQFTKLKSEVQVPKPVDLTAQKAERERQAKERYDKLLPTVQRDMEKVLTGLDTIEITEQTKEGNNPVFSYALGDYKSSKHVRETIDKVIDTIARNAQEWSPSLAKEVVEKTVEQLQNDYWIANRTAIIKAAQDNARKQAMDEEFAKSNNHRPLNPDASHPGMTKEQQKLIQSKEQVRKNLGLTGRQFKAS